MKRNESSVFIFMASIIIGVLISSNISFGRHGTMEYLTTKQYLDAYNKKSKYFNEINDLNKKYTELYTKIRQYENNGANTQEAERQIKEELNYRNILLGKADVSGEGIEIKLDDYGEGFKTSAAADSPSINTTIHNFDMDYVINNLKLAGAEVISIDDMRIVDRTGVDCYDAFLKINQVRVPAPFYIKAIGDKDKLKEFMTAKANYLEFLKIRGISVTVTTNDNIVISAYDGKIKDDYLKESIKNN